MNAPSRFEYRERAEWPPLAWLAACSPDSDAIEVQHGSKVETRPDWFGELAWDGPLEAADFDRTDLVYGSGCRLRDDEAIFVSSATTVDRLQHLKIDNRHWISNSLVCLLATTQAEVPPLYPWYAVDFRSIVNGLDRYRRELSTSRGPVRIVYFRNLRWSGTSLEDAPKLEPERDLSSFALYREFLQSALVRIARNAADPFRRTSFKLLGTISTGFDSPTASALAREAGLRETITMDRAREGQDDSGAQIGARLGLEVTVVERDRWREQPLAEAPFLAADAKGEDAYFRSAEAHLSDRLVLTGYAAGPWKARPALHDDLRRADQSGLSLTEYRLQAGFLNLPVPTMGARTSRQLYELMHSSELDPWRSRLSYDKPFCRRVLVEAGVPPDLFAQEDKAASVLFFDRRTFLTPSSVESYSKFLKATEASRPVAAARAAAIHTALRCGSLGARALQTSAQRLQAVRAGGASLVRRVAKSGRLSEAAHFEPRYTSLFPWAVNIASSRYTSPQEKD